MHLFVQSVFEIQSRGKAVINFALNIYSRKVCAISPRPSETVYVSSTVNLDILRTPWVYEIKKFSIFPVSAMRSLAGVP